MKSLVAIFLFLLFSVIMNGQETKSMNESGSLHIISFNIGEGSSLSLNYERLFNLESNFFLAGQLGIGYNEDYDRDTGETTDRFVVLPHHFTGNLGGKRSFFEFGITGLCIFGDVKNSYLWGPLIGYRLHPLKTKRIGFRAYLNFPLKIFKNIGNPFWPEFTYDRDFMYVPIGFSIGYCF